VTGWVLTGTGLRRSTVVVVPTEPEIVRAPLLLKEQEHIGTNWDTIAVAQDTRGRESHVIDVKCIRAAQIHQPVMHPLAPDGCMPCREMLPSLRWMVASLLRPISVKSSSAKAFAGD